VRPNQPRLMWLAFAAAVLVVIAAMGWTTRAVLRLDAAEAESRQKAQLEENVRLALWRMDSALAPLIAAEHARPATAYHPLGGFGGYTGYPSARSGYPAPGLVYASGERPEPVPLPGINQPFARLYFQYLGAAPPTTPQAPGDAVRSNLERLTDVAPFDRLVAALPPAARADRPDGSQALARVPTKGEQALRNAQEYQARAQNNVQQLQVQAAANRAGDAGSAPAPVFMRPIWIGDELVLARRVALLGNRDAVQGCWVDWPAVRSWLLASVKDVLPDATLVPLEPGAADPSARQLASLPVRLVPGEIAGARAAAPPSPLRTSLLVAWVCVVLATAAVALLLRGVISLSERRGAFVSAVTHELRTPLTTLRMYTEMLEGGMVADPAQRQNYLATLRAEADRLGHLVENVLAYSRLERNRAGYEVTVLKLADVLPRIAERLAERARQAGMELVVEIPAGIYEQPVRTNALALEQILFNLVDNACKYAAGAADRRIHLSGAAHDEVDTVCLDVRDHGPGIAPSLAKRLFHPFSKSVQEAANTAPGLGLGLSLSRRLAESMGGELKLLGGTAGGAAFAVTLPRS